MLLFRSLALGLLSACFFLLAFRPTYVVRVEPAAPARVATATGPTLVDVGQGVSSAAITQLVHLAPDEHIIAIDDRPVADDLDAGAALATHPLWPGGYIDLTVAAATHQRRVLVLFH